MSNPTYKSKQEFRNMMLWTINIYELQRELYGAWNDMFNAGEIVTIENKE